MKKVVSRQEMMREVMRSAHLRYRMGQRYSWAEEKTWGDCLRAAWEGVRMSYQVAKTVKVEAVRIERYMHNVDLTTHYGVGAYMGD